MLWGWVRHPNDDYSNINIFNFFSTHKTTESFDLNINLKKPLGLTVGLSSIFPTQNKVVCILTFLMPSS